ERELFLDLGKVAVPGNAVGPQALVALREQVRDLRLAPGAADAAERIDDDPGGIDQVLAEQGEEWQQYARGVAAGGRDESRARVRRAVGIVQAVNGAHE